VRAYGCAVQEIVATSGPVGVHRPLLDVAASSGQ